MYEFLEGRVARHEPTRLVLEVGGVGYDLAIPLGVDFKRVASGSSTEEAPERIRVWTHFVVREDAQMLFGFPDPKMRELFRMLLKVRGVGPGLAQAILSSLPEAELLEAISAGDVRPLTRIKGVGKKTAEQILLDLRDRAPMHAAAAAAAGDPALDEVDARTRADAVAALVSIGYTPKQAETSVEKAARNLGERIAEEELETLVRAALTE